MKIRKTKEKKNKENGCVNVREGKIIKEEKCIGGEYKKNRSDRYAGKKNLSGDILLLENDHHGNALYIYIVIRKSVWSGLEETYVSGQSESLCNSKKEIHSDFYLFICMRLSICL